MSYSEIRGPGEVAGTPFVNGSVWSYQNGNRTHDNFEDHEDRITALESGFSGANPILAYDLGGSTLWGLRVSSFTQVPDVRHAKVAGTLPSGYSARAVVQYKTAHAGTAVDWQVVDIDDSNTVVASGTSYSGGTTLQYEEQAITLNAANHRYELQVKGSNTNSDVFAAGRIELYVP